LYPLLSAERKKPVFRPRDGMSRACEHGGHVVIQREPLGHDPLAVLARWIDEAGAAGLTAPNAMTLATANAAGAPHARTVLVTAIDGDGLRFHSSRPTGKTADLAANPQAAGVLVWPALGRQVTVHGPATELPASVSRAAFGTRPVPLRRLAWAYDELLPALAGPDHPVDPGAVERAFAAAGPGVDMPPSWTTVELRPDRVDIWQAGDEHSPPTRTRFVRGPAGWRAFPVLP
jgi:pyridoxamine 5'-phosphate oxidase